MTTLNELLESEPRLLSFPETIQELLILLNRPNMEMQRVITLIEQDVALAARILRLANSPYYGAMMRVGNIPHAIAMLGSLALRDIVIATAVQERFDQLTAARINLPAFWNHSLLCAMAARTTYHLIGINNPVIFPAALLHNIGSLLMLQQLPDEMREINQRVRQDGGPRHRQENELLGFDHGRVGAELMRLWGLPEIFSVVARYHDHLEESPQFQLETAVVHMGEQLADRRSPDINLSPSREQPDEAVFRIASLRELDMKAVEERMDALLPGYPV